MNRMIAAILLVSWSGSLFAQNEKQGKVPTFDYDVAREHELEPHRRTIPQTGVSPGFNQLHLSLIVSPIGNVVNASANGEAKILKFWPRLKSEVFKWKFKPFQMNGIAVSAEVEEYIDLVPAERLPQIHTPPPNLHADSNVLITLERTGCFGTCPSYTVTVSTNGIVFDGSAFVVAVGEHKDKVNADEVRNLAKRFIAADFYSMDSTYVASVTDNPTFTLSITVDGRTKKVVDYVGSWKGMPAVISDLEVGVDKFASTSRWVEGSDGLVQVLKEEDFKFQSFEAQTMLKRAANRGQADTVSAFLKAGVPLIPLSAPKPEEKFMEPSLNSVGWLTATSNHTEIVERLIEAGASKDDQSDKDLALIGAASSGNVVSARALIAYGANPNFDFSSLKKTEGFGRLGTVLIHAAESGDPEMVREILQYHPSLEAQDREGKTAVFAAGEYRYRDKNGARVECVRLLVQAGANVNASDNKGNTPLHETFLTDVEMELLKLGANVNARNNEGESPLFTTVNDDAIPIFIAHGADLSIRNKKGESVLEAAKVHGPVRQELLRKAIEKLQQH
ncbi:MAG TPA: ankyrin repeat domain-containing protein [Candidatus Saccharimonadales bacterium]|nr:ankyrin repeat domain-containing protein [Candidatus Saccharimonadales bacterium]